MNKKTQANHAQNNPHAVLKTPVRLTRTKSRLGSFSLILAIIGSVCQAAELPVISSFSGNGYLVATNLQPGTFSSVQWASSLNGPWQKDWANLTKVKVDSNGVMAVSVPMFYRVLGMAYASNPTNAEGMRLIPAGSFTMGNISGDTDIPASDILPAPMQIFVSAFYIEPTKVTYAQWLSVYNWAVTNGYDIPAGTGAGTNYPVTGVNWYDAIKWCNARSDKAGLNPVYFTDPALTHVYKSGTTNVIGTNNVVYVDWTVGFNGYRLPTDAEWEKAARGGLTGFRFPWGDTISHAEATYNSQFGIGGAPLWDLGPYSGQDTNFISTGSSPVGYFAANGYGLYDMAGNVQEWVWDAQSGLGVPTTNNPTGPGLGSSHFLRGGGYPTTSDRCRVARRFSITLTPSIGAGLSLRCVRGYTP